MKIITSVTLKNKLTVSNRSNHNLLILKYVYKIVHLIKAACSKTLKYVKFWVHLKAAVNKLLDLKHLIKTRITRDALETLNKCIQTQINLYHLSIKRTPESP